MLVKRIILVVILVPLAVILITLAVANRSLVPFTFDPFHPGDPSLTVALPLFVWIVASLAVGVALGGAATWMRQGAYRSLARRNGREAEALRRQAAAAKAAPPVAPSPEPVRPAQQFTALPKPSR